MMRIKSDWMKRGICLALAGMLALCPESAVYAASAEKQISVNAQEAEATTEDTRMKTEKPQIVLQAESKYREISLGEKINLPQYTLQYTDGDDVTAEWSTDGLGIVILDAANLTVTGAKTGVTALKLAIKGTDIFVEYYIVVAPAAPASASADSCTHDSVGLTWAAAPDASGYAIYRKAGNEGDFKEIARVGGESVSYTDKNSVELGTTYTYRIVSYIEYKDETGAVKYAESKEFAQFTAKPMLAAPAIKAQVEGEKAVKLSWDAVSGANGYEIYRKVSGTEEFQSIQTITNGSETVYTDKNVEIGTNYHYKIRAFHKTEGITVWGEDSNEAAATPAIAAPSKVNLTNTSYNSIRLSWEKVSHAAGYKVLRSSRAADGYRTIATVKGNSKRSYTDKKLSYGKIYYYKVCAYSTVSGADVDGLRSEAAVGKAVPPATKVKSEAAGASAMKLTWSKVTLPSKNSGYHIYKVVNGKSEKIKSCNNKTTSYTVKNLTPGVKYAFKVVPYVKDSKGATVLGLDSNLITAAPKLLPVSIETVEAAADGSLLVSWKATKDAGEEKYVVYRSSSKKGRYSSVGTVARKEGVKKYHFTDKDISFGKRYYYKIRCTRTLEDGTFMKSAYSAVKAGKASVAAPTLTVTADHSEALKLTWKKVEVSSGRYVDGYAIYRSNTEKGTYKKIKTITNGKTTKYTDEGLATGNTYYYKIRSYYKYKGKTVYSSYSEAVSKQTLPAAPVIKASSLDYQTVRISWKQVEGCSGYQIKRSSSPDGTFRSVKTVSSAKTLYYDNGKLTTGQDYYYKVRAFVTKDGKKIYGEYSEVKAGKPVLGKPEDLTGTAVGDNQIKLTWKAVAGAKTYTIVRSASLDGVYKIASEICDTNSFVDTNVAVGNTYYYKVQAIRDDMASEFTDPVGVTATVLTLGADKVTMKTGTSIKLTATVKPEAYISWSSDNPQIAVVSSDGTVYALKEGTATINVTANNITKKVTVTVKDKIGTENKGIEISSGNGAVDFNAIRSAGYEYVMLRISSGTTEDKNFRTNLKAAKAAGLKVGVYCYSKAQTKTAAISEAKKVLSILNGEKLDYPVVYDLEDMSLLYNNVTKTERVEFVTAFRSEIINAGKGYQFILGISQNLLKEYPDKYIDTSKLAGFDIWMYNCRAEKLGHGYQGTGTVVMWRYTDSGTVHGITGKVCISNRYRTY